jgi:hypothetical protein
MQALSDILELSNATTRRELLAAWALTIVERAPAMRHGAVRLLTPVEHKSIVNLIVAEFLRTDSNDQMPMIDDLTKGFDQDQAEANLRHALWHRAAELIAQECENKDPEFKHARRRVRSFLNDEASLRGLIHFSAFNVHYLSTEHSAARRDQPILPRDELLRRFMVPEDALKYGDGLAQFILLMLEELQTVGPYRPWISVDDLAYLLAQAEERKNSREWMAEPVPPTIDGTAPEVRALFEKAQRTVLHWFDTQYAPSKAYTPEIQSGLRSAFCDHLRLLLSDPDNHPGLTALIQFHFPNLSAAEYRNSSIRKDFEYMIKRFREELRGLARDYLGG